MTDKIRAVIDHFGMTQKDLSERIGVSQSAITAIMKGRTTVITKPLAIAISTRLGVSERWLLTGEGDMFDMDTVGAINEKNINLIRALNRNPKIRSLAEQIIQLNESDIPVVQAIVERIIQK